MDELQQINTLFENVKELRDEMFSNFNDIQTKIKSLKEVYVEVSKRHQNSECNLGVDSLYFQNELITREYNNQQELFTFINNRIYCEYYKLYHMITEYVKNDIQSPDLTKQITSSISFPKYKSLEPLKEYDFTYVSQLYTHIVNVISNLNSYTEVQKNDLLVDNRRMEMGLNIDNVVHSQIFLHSVLNEKIKMFTQYLKTFQTHHIKYLTRLSSKIKLVLNIIKDDIGMRKSPTPIADSGAEIKDCEDDTQTDKVVIDVVNNIIKTIEEKNK